MKNLNRTYLYGHFAQLGALQTEKVVAEYVWIDGTGINMRSKCRTLDKKVTKLSDIPDWNFDGSSCHQASTENSEIILKPVAFYPDPFKGGDNILVMCCTYAYSGENFDTLVPANTNFRHFAESIMNEVEESEPWFGIEQEYTLFEKLDNFTKQPLGWPKGGFPAKQGPYYCSVGTTACVGRVVSDMHYKACLAARINISGTNSEVMPGSWEFQVGPCTGIEIGDQLWMARYILWRITEDLNIGLSFHPKPIKGEWNGSGCHVNFSTEEMRLDGGYEHILEAITALELRHDKHISMYGEENKERLRGKNETSSLNNFTHGVGDRTASVRIPSQAKIDGKGYFEDRRPASDIDPYVVSALLCSTIQLKGEGAEELQRHYNNWRAERNKIDV